MTVRDGRQQDGQRCRVGQQPAGNPKRQQHAELRAVLRDKVDPVGVVCAPPVGMQAGWMAVFNPVRVGLRVFVLVEHLV